jgi:anion-transporting  ArsA/GET3 family ATPase
MDKLTDTFMEKLQEMVKKNIKNELKTPQIKNLVRHKNNEMSLKKTSNRYQSETKESIKTEIYEIKKTTQDTKEELKKDMENF